MGSHIEYGKIASIVRMLPKTVTPSIVYTLEVLAYHKLSSSSISFNHCSLAQINGKILSITTIHIRILWVRLITDNMRSPVE
mmetsp:Transcript_12383/g.19898  ORF Transcript_12383/g.19898 Transcript_12383/m.19898 type:complete len:82 (+) Transcript_12383:400-645(+)